MDWIWSPVFGVPFIVFFLFFGGMIVSSYASFALAYIWGRYFDTIIWNEDQMTEILGEDLMRNHRSRR